MLVFIFGLLTIFASVQAEENFILMNGSTGEVLYEQGSLLDTRMSPACSFNIALSLMGYDAEVLKDLQTPIWDYEVGYDSYIASWIAPQTPQIWMGFSCVWYSKLLSLELGLEKVQSYLALFEYGNQDISGGLARPGSINSAWVSSSLKISPKEQVHFIQKMIQRRIPVSNRAIEMTKCLGFKEVLSGGGRLYGKTGLSCSAGSIRWFVGWVEKEDAFFPFAYVLCEKEVDVTLTIPRVKELLQSHF